jgi:hypothetical protein
MDYSAASRDLQPAAAHPGGLLAELYQAQVALGAAEYHHRLWFANSATENVPFRAYRAYAAQEAVHEAGGIIDRIAELLRIEAAGTLAIPYPDHSAQTCADSGGVK